MEKDHIKSAEIKSFKKLSDVKLDNLGQFNLIIGNNNVGKSSVLEALTADLNYSNFFDSLGNINFHVKKFSNLKTPFINLYFENANSIYPKNFRIDFLSGGNYPQSIDFTAADPYRFEINGIKFESGSSDDFSTSNNIYEGRPININMPFIPMGSFYNHELTTLYSNNIQLFVDKKERLLNALTYLIPKIKNIEVNAGMSSSPILLLSETGKNSLSPLATYGEGALKLFRIALSLFSNNHYNRLMIDEIDTGIHYSHLKDFLKSLLLLATEEKKQIFATTHSKECIEEFTKALEETGMQNEGRIIRLSETKHGIKAFTMEFAEFENALLAESEIR